MSRTGGPGALAWAMKWDTRSGGYVWLKAVTIRVWRETITPGGMMALCALATIEKRRGHRRGVYGLGTFILVEPNWREQVAQDGQVMARLYKQVAERRGAVSWMRPAPADE